MKTAVLAKNNDKGITNDFPILNLQIFRLLHHYQLFACAFSWTFHFIRVEITEIEIDRNRDGDRGSDGDGSGKRGIKRGG